MNGGVPAISNGQRERYPFTKPMQRRARANLPKATCPHAKQGQPISCYSTWCWAHPQRDQHEVQPNQLALPLDGVNIESEYHHALASFLGNETIAVARPPFLPPKTATVPPLDCRRKDNHKIIPRAPQQAALPPGALVSPPPPLPPPLATEDR